MASYHLFLLCAVFLQDIGNNGSLQLPVLYNPSIILFFAIFPNLLCQPFSSLDRLCAALLCPSCLNMSCQ